MPIVASVDYPNKRIYLDASTVNTDLDTMDIYQEVRELRRTTEAHRQFHPIIVGGGNVEKITGISYTLPFVQLLYGCRIVPFNTSHRLRVVRDTFTDDGVAGRDCFDRTPLAPGTDVDIDVDFEKVEVRIVSPSLSVSEISEAVLTGTVEGSLSLRDSLKISNAVSSSKSSVTDLGGGNATVVFRDAADTLDRVTASLTGSERTSVTLNLG